MAEDTIAVISTNSVAVWLEIFRLEPRQSSKSVYKFCGMLSPKPYSTVSQATIAYDMSDSVLPLYVNTAVGYKYVFRTYEIGKMKRIR